MSIEFHPQAEVEFIEQAAYYESRISQLGHIFLAELESVLSLLVEHPEIGSIIEIPFRNFAMKRFPHSLIYTVEPESIWVIAVAHQKQKPGYWKERVKY